MIMMVSSLNLVLFLSGWLGIQTISAVFRFCSMYSYNLSFSFPIYFIIKVDDRIS